jgi:hypothetical protein
MEPVSTTLTLAKLLGWAYTAMKAASVAKGAYDVKKAVFDKPKPGHKTNRLSGLASGVGGVVGGLGGLGVGGDNAGKLAKIGGLVKSYGDQGGGLKAGLGAITSMQPLQTNRLLKAMEDNKAETDRHSKGDGEGPAITQAQAHTDLQNAEDDSPAKRFSTSGLNNPLLKKILEMTNLGVGGFASHRIGG